MYDTRMGQWVAKDNGVFNPEKSRYMPVMTVLDALSRSHLPEVLDLTLRGAGAKANLTTPWSLWWWLKPATKLQTLRVLDGFDRAWAPWTARPRPPVVLGPLPWKQGLICNWNTILLRHRKTLQHVELLGDIEHHALPCPLRREIPLPELDDKKLPNPPDPMLNLGESMRLVCLPHMEALRSLKVPLRALLGAGFRTLDVTQPNIAHLWALAVSGGLVPHSVLAPASCKVVDLRLPPNLEELHLYEEHTPYHVVRHTHAPNLLNLYDDEEDYYYDDDEDYDDGDEEEGYDDSGLNTVPESPWADSYSDCCFMALVTLMHVLDCFAEQVCPRYPKLQSVRLVCFGCERDSWGVDDNGGPMPLGYRRWSGWGAAHLSQSFAQVGVRFQAVLENEQQSSDSGTGRIIGELEDAGDEKGGEPQGGPGPTTSLLDYAMQRASRPEIVHLLKSDLAKEYY